MAIVTRTLPLAIACAGALLSANTAHAIINIASKQVGLPEQGWSGEVSVALEGKTGNTHEKDYAGAARVNWRQADDILVFIGGREYGSVNDVIDDDESFAHLRWIHVLNSQWATEVFAQWQENRFSNTELRELMGGGMRYDFFPTGEDVKLAAGLGAFREKEKLDLISREETSYTTRANAYIAYEQAFNERVKLTNVLYYQPAINEFSDFRLHNDLALTVKMTERLALSWRHLTNHDSDPATNYDLSPSLKLEETNTTYLTSFVYTF